MESKEIAGKTVHCVGVAACSSVWPREIVAAEIEAPRAWDRRLARRVVAPAGETQVVFRDSAFADDVAKTNVTATLKQRGIESVRSL